MKQKPTKTKTAIRSIIAGAVCLLAICFVGQKSITEAQTVETKRDKPELVVQTGHGDLVFSVAFSPDGKTIASGSKDNTVILWDVQTGQQIKTLEGYFGVVAFSPNGKTLASVSSNNTIKIWNIETGQQVKSFIGHTSNVNSVTFSPDGKTLASGSNDNTIRLWNTETGQLVKFLVVYTPSVYSVTFSPDGKTLASGNFDKTIKLWDTETGLQIKSLEGHSDRVKSVAFSLDGKILASGSYDSTIKLWNVETGQQIKSLEGHIYPVNSVVFSPDGKTLISGSNDNTIKLWAIETGQQVKSFNGHGNMVNSVVFSPDGKTLASGSDDNTVKLWSVETGAQVKSLEGSTSGIYSVTFSPDGKTLASGNSDKTIKLWNIETGQQIKSLNGHSALIESIAFSPDGKTLASGGGENTIKLWNVETGQEIKSLNGHIFRVRSIAFSPDGKTFASGSDDKTIKIWNIETGQQIKSLTGHTSGVSSVVFSPDGKTLASGSHDFTIKLWDVSTGKQIKDLTGHNFFVYSVVFSPDGKTLASGSHDNTIKLWNTETGQQIKPLKGHISSVWSVSFSPDGKTLASGSWDNTIKLWDVETGQEIKSLNGHTYSVESVIFSPDGKTLVSGSRDITIKLWNVESESLLSTLISLDKDDWVVTTPDGRFDTNEDLNKIEGLIWVLPDQPLTPKPLELFMRQYYEPGLLPRVLRCTEEGSCDKEFKPLPSIAEINRVQPRVEIREIRAKANNSETVDVVVEVESRTEEFNRDGKKTAVSSGVYDLRLFRDGQLIRTSARSADLEEYIRLAPALVEKDRAAKNLLNTEEDKAWRRANDLGAVAKFEKNKATFVFENVRLPRDGRDKIEFSAYAFNGDRVKSETSRRTFEIKSPTARAGNTYLVSIGVSASENPAYNLRYAAVDAYKTQEILGERLKAKLKGTNSKLIQIQLVSDFDKDQKLREKTATKPVIKALFDRLAGKPNEAADFPVLVDGQKVAAADLPPVEPEDTLIITYSGHGYADRNGIFYLLPFDVGKETEKLSTEVLPRLISSDELSLWMRDVTAREMLMIVDACHSAAAVQGDGFKPGPMGSRGLGQLAYDKGMKILSATQADNVALELGGSLRQGLLSYALLQDGIFSKKADTDSNTKLFYREWLKYGEARVPALYDGIKKGTIKGVTIDDKPPTEQQRAAVFCVDKSCRQNVQQPRLFDFNQNRPDGLLINLP